MGEIILYVIMSSVINSLVCLNLFSISKVAINRRSEKRIEELGRYINRMSYYDSLTDEEFCNIPSDEQEEVYQYFLNYGMPAEFFDRRK